MDFQDTSTEFFSMTSGILLMLLSTHRALQLHVEEELISEDDVDMLTVPTFVDDYRMGAEEMNRAALYSSRVWNNPSMLDGDLGFWVKPRSTAWFSRFLLDQYDDQRWVQMFRMPKAAVFSLSDLLEPAIRKKDTNYRLAIRVLVRVACTLFKLTHAASLLVCSEFFAVERSSVSMVLREVVHAINDTLRHKIAWPHGETLASTEAEFHQLCGLPAIVGAIDCTHVAISKPRVGAADYYYFKSGAYSLNCQAVVDSQKKFLDLFLGMPGSTNDARVLKRSTLYHKANHNCLWDCRSTFAGFSPYLVGDSTYPLAPWLMVPHRGGRPLPPTGVLFNKKLRRARGIVENAFAQLKGTFRELQGKSDLQVTFLPDVIVSCAILHNILLQQNNEEVERLLQVLRTEGLGAAGGPHDVPHVHVQEVDDEDCTLELGMRKRLELGQFLNEASLLPTSLSEV